MTEPIAPDDDVDDGSFQTLVGCTRTEQPLGGEIIELQFAEGGRVQILTPYPLIWIQPGRH